MTVASKLDLVRTHKESIRVAIEAKGQVIPAVTPLSDYSGIIAAIETGSPLAVAPTPIMGAVRAVSVDQDKVKLLFATAQDASVAKIKVVKALGTSIPDLPLEGQTILEYNAPTTEILLTGLTNQTDYGLWILTEDAEGTLQTMRNTGNCKVVRNANGEYLGSLVKTGLPAAYAGVTGIIVYALRANDGWVYSWTNNVAYPGLYALNPETIVWSAIIAEGHTFTTFMTDTTLFAVNPRGVSPTYLPLQTMFAIEFGVVLSSSVNTGGNTISFLTGAKNSQNTALCLSYHDSTYYRVVVFTYSAGVLTRISAATPSYPSLLNWASSWPFYDTFDATPLNCIIFSQTNGARFLTYNYVTGVVYSSSSLGTIQTIFVDANNNVFFGQNNGAQIFDGTNFMTIGYDIAPVVGSSKSFCTELGIPVFITGIPATGGIYWFDNAAVQFKFIARPLNDTSNTFVPSFVNVGGNKYLHFITGTTMSSWMPTGMLLVDMTTHTSSVVPKPTANAYISGYLDIPGYLVFLDKYTSAYAAGGYLFNKTTLLLEVYYAGSTTNSYRTYTAWQASNGEVYTWCYGSKDLYVINLAALTRAAVTGTYVDSPGTAVIFFEDATYVYYLPSGEGLQGSRIHKTTYVAELVAGLYWSSRFNQGAGHDFWNSVSFGIRDGLSPIDVGGTLFSNSNVMPSQNALYDVRVGSLNDCIIFNK